LGSFWEGSLATEENLTKWKNVIDIYHDSIVVCADTEIYILWLKKRKHPLKIEIPKVLQLILSRYYTGTDCKLFKMAETKLIHSDKTYAGWVLSPSAIEEPCIVFSRGSLIWMYNPIQKGICSYLRGHGGVRPSLSVLHEGNSRNVF
jgi:polycomb protein EED